VTQADVSFRRGLRLGAGFAGVPLLLSISFGVVAVDAGLSPLQALVMSALVHAGSGQFAAVAVFGGGAGVVPAVLASGLTNSRFLAMGIAVAPSLPGRPWSRALQAQTVVDPSFVMANRHDGTFDRWLLFGAFAPQYVGWFTGTTLGAFGGDLLGDTDRLGVDAVFPAFFLALLIAELRRPETRWVALGGGLIALALVPFTPPGVPILAAALAALVALR
jgi:4-azaleucine resistance transporter AzlC